MSDHAVPLLVVVSTILASCLAAHAAAPTAGELSRARHWAEAHLRRAPGVPPEPAYASAAPGLVVIANHDAVLINGRPDGRPLQIADDTFSHGLLCHAVSEVEVHLRGPGRTFSATAGLDTNAGGGSIVFSVQVRGEEAFRSGVMHCGEPGVPVSVDLGGATSFTLHVGDAGDGIACDHADWAEARVTLLDGAELRLCDLAVREAEVRPRRAHTPPFSFLYDGRSSDESLPTWDFSETVERLSAGRTHYTQTYTDPESGLQVRCVGVRYSDFPVVEWTLHFRNTGEQDTSIIEDVLALDTQFRKSGTGDFLLHHNVGSPCRANDFEPLETPLGRGESKTIRAAGGRPTNSDLCTFNLQWPGEGAIVALGWPGQWAARFSAEGATTARVTAGQELTHFRLHPGEEVRSPLVALLLWEGDDRLRAQNLWRRWMVRHNLPRIDGQPVPTHYGACFGNLQPRAEEELAVIEGFRRESIPLEYWFIDAGWYPGGGEWVNTGTWEIDTERFPRGLREVADRVHSYGMKFVVWFEPERVTAGSWLAENHPEWVLGGKGGGLLNLGDPAAWSWAVERIDSLLTSQRIDVYRQDFNMDPLGYWHSNDPPDRRGITEMKHVAGYLALWDEILRRHPGLFIDTCASGGRRNDLETLRRSVPLLRSDYWDDTTAQQAQTMGLAAWMPYFGSGMSTSDPYWFRSCIFPASRIGWDTRDESLDYPLLRRMIAECKRVQQYMLGDFWPLTPYSLNNDAWMAWQFSRPERGDGIVQAFRRADCGQESVRLKLRDLEADAQYAVTDLDTQSAQVLSGRSLMDDGLELTASARPAALIVEYRKVR